MVGSLLSRRASPGKFRGRARTFNSPDRVPRSSFAQDGRSAEGQGARDFRFRILLLSGSRLRCSMIYTRYMSQRSDVQY